MTVDDAAGFRTLKDLHVQGVGYGTLASAVEATGIWGYDRFDRLSSFKPAGDEARRALDVIWFQYRDARDGPRDGCGVPDPESPWWCWGWPTSRLPAVLREGGADGGEVADVPNAKAINNLHRLVGNLIELLREAGHGTSGRRYRSVQDIKDALTVGADGEQQFSPRYLDTVFAKAKAACNNST